MSTDYKYTGHPQPGHTANIAGDGVIIPSPGAGKFIVIVDILATTPLELRENDADGALIAYIPQGSTRLDSSINAGWGNDGLQSDEGNAIYCKGIAETFCTINFAKVRKPPDSPIPDDPCYGEPKERDCPWDCCKEFIRKEEYNTWQDAFDSVHHFLIKHAIAGDCRDELCKELPLGGVDFWCYTIYCYPNPKPGPRSWFGTKIWGYVLCGRDPDTCTSPSPSPSPSPSSSPSPSPSPSP